VHADWLFVGGSVITMDRSRSVAVALAVKGGWISDIGSTNALLALKGPSTRMVDLAGRALVPGFYDAHQHQVYMGLSFRQMDCRAASIEQIVQRIRRRADSQPAGTWVEGTGYDDNKMVDKRHPTRWDLDRATSDHPVFIVRTCGHVMVLNSRALDLAGIRSDTLDPIGGSIDRDAVSGEPTGVIRESAMEMLRRIVPLPSIDEIKTAICAAARLNLSLGITSVWEPSVEPDHVEAYCDLEADNQLPLRVTMAQKKILRSGKEVPLPRPFRRPWLSLQAVKLFQDGGIGPRTAALTEPYQGQPENRGLMRWSQPELDAMVEEIHRAGLRASVHAIGDAAVASVLKSLEAALTKESRNDHRHRIEHCGVCPPYLHRQLAGLEPVIAVQPTFLYYDGDVYEENVGRERARWLYPIRSLLELGLTIAGSSDGPVVKQHGPLRGIQSAVTRQSINGNVVAPEERIGLAEAMALFTTNGARAGGEEEAKGSLEPGKLADLVVLGEDPRRVSPEDLASIPVDLVLVAGQLAFERES